MVVYGDDVIAEPMLVPSTLNCTFATATLSEAVAVRVTDDPETVAPLDGAVSETDGGVVSGVGAVLLPLPPPPPPKPGLGIGISVELAAVAVDEALAALSEDCAFGLPLCCEPDEFAEVLL